MGYQPYKTISYDGLSSNYLDSTIVASSQLDISAGASLGTNLKDEILNLVFEKLSQAPVRKIKCSCCGANVEWSSKKHIFICPYCDTTYAIGTTMLNDIGD